MLAWVHQLQEHIAFLERRLECLRTQITQLLEANRDLEAGNAALRAQVEQLRREGAPVFKPNRKKANLPKEPRKKRSHSFVRRLERPTQEVVHACERCPRCDEPLCGGFEKRRRQVIELPVTPVQIIDHVVIERRCPRCHESVAPRLNSQQLGVVGEHRVGVRLMAWVGLMHIVGRVPLAIVQRILKGVYGLHISRGELSEILHTIARIGKDERAQLLKELRAAPVVHADETGWRENGDNGYIWSFSTPAALPNPVRYFEYQKSRAGQVALDILGEQFEGTVVSDFYAGYNALLGPHQRCWVHLLRDVHKLKEKHPDDESVKTWAKQVYLIYIAAKQWRPEATQAPFEQQERLLARLAFERALMEVARPYLDVEGAPQRVLSQRIARFLCG